MFGFLKADPEKARARRAAKLEKEWLALLEAARDLQRGGDIPGFAKKTAEAEALRSELDALTAESGDQGSKR